MALQTPPIETQLASSRKFIRCKDETDEHDIHLTDAKYAQFNYLLFTLMSIHNKLYHHDEW